MSRALDDVAIIGVGMHPWGKWGRNFVDYGLVAAEAAMDDAGVEWSDVELVAGGETVRCGYPGFVAGATMAQALGWNGAAVSTSYAACASGAAALDIARTKILAGACDVALVVGADSAPKGFFAPADGAERPEDPDWRRFRLVGMTNPAYFGLWARRRMSLYGTTSDHLDAVKVKNSRHGLHNPNARYRKEFSAREVSQSPLLADPLRLMHVCATSDGAAALVVSSLAFARRNEVSGAVRLRAVSTVTPRFPASLEMPELASDSTLVVGAPPVPYRESIAAEAYDQAGVGPDDLDFAEVYDLSTALELDWYEAIGICGEGEAEHLLENGDTTLGGRVPVNPSGGLACFGEAVPAQALAQVCELTWQLRGVAGVRQVEDAKVGLAINQGLFGHGSAVIAVR